MAHHGSLDGPPAAQIGCEDSYSLRVARLGKHAPLTLYVADHSGKAFAWRKVRETCTTLEEAKARAEQVLLKFPQFIPTKEDEK